MGGLCKFSICRVMVDYECVSLLTVLADMLEPKAASMNTKSMCRIVRYIQPFNCASELVVGYLLRRHHGQSQVLT